MVLLHNSNFKLYFHPAGFHVFFVTIRCCKTLVSHNTWLKVLYSSMKGGARPPDVGGCLGRWRWVFEVCLFYWTEAQQHRYSHPESASSKGKCCTSSYTKRKHKIGAFFKILISETSSSVAIFPPQIKQFPCEVSRNTWNDWMADCLCKGNAFSRNPLMTVYYLSIARVKHPLVRRSCWCLLVSSK